MSERSYHGVTSRSLHGYKCTWNVLKTQLTAVGAGTEMRTQYYQPAHIADRRATAPSGPGYSTRACQEFNKTNQCLRIGDIRFNSTTIYVPSPQTHQSKFRFIQQRPSCSIFTAIYFYPGIFLLEM